MRAWATVLNAAWWVFIILLMVLPIFGFEDRRDIVLVVFARWVIKGLYGARVTLNVPARSHGLVRFR